jgi:hypothetical protein
MTGIGRKIIEYFLTAYMGDEARGSVKVFEAQTGQMLSYQSLPLFFTY